MYLSINSLMIRRLIARDMFHRSLALECPPDRLRVLNYAPGPMDTGMQRQIREEMPDDSELKRQFREMFSEGRLVNPKDSARRLVRLLRRDQYENGAHVDYYDVDDDGRIIVVADEQQKK